MEMLDILKSAVDTGASDIHICIGKPPMVRIDGKITSLQDFKEETITEEESKRLIYSILYEEQIQRFEEIKELDASFYVPEPDECEASMKCGVLPFVNQPVETNMKSVMPKEDLSWLPPFMAENKDLWLWLPDEIRERYPISDWRVDAVIDVPEGKI